MRVDGIDVSKWQGRVDWDEVINDGKKFVIIRASDGTVAANEQNFAQNWAGASGTSLIMGAYHYFRPSADMDNINAQADLFLSTFSSGVPVVQVQYLPAALDVEQPAGGVTNDDYMAGIRAWISRVESDGRFAGRKTMIYTRQSFWAQIGNPSDFVDRRLWVADFSQDPPRLPAGWIDFTFFQSTAAGTVSGIQGDVDLDVFNGSMDDLTALAAAPPVG